MKLIELIVGNTDLDELIDYQANLNNPSCTTFIKDLNGKYLSCNNVMAHHFGGNTSGDIVGMNDYEFHSRSIAKSVRTNDADVVSSRSVKVFNERFKSLGCSGDEMVATSIKTPLKNDKQKIIGVMGFSIIHSQTSLREKAKQEYGLTSRQLDCLSLIVKGMSMKLIANTLRLSKRTVEHYVEAIKLKLNCFNKAQLIAKALDISYIKMLL